MLIKKNIIYTHNLLNLCRSKGPVKAAIVLKWKRFSSFFFFLIIDLIFSQLFLLNILEKKILEANKDSYDNRVFNKDYNYTFNKLVNFNSQYYGKIYKISTNDLGFRDDSSKPLDRKKNYSIIIGDSFVEGVGLEYKDTIVGLLNNNFTLKNNHKFLNAGVASYSSYIYLKKTTKTLTTIKTNIKMMLN